MALAPRIASSVNFSEEAINQNLTQIHTLIGLKSNMQYVEPEPIMQKTTNLSQLIFNFQEIYIENAEKFPYKRVEVATIWQRI